MKTYPGGGGGGGKQIKKRERTKAVQHSFPHTLNQILTNHSDGLVPQHMHMELLYMLGHATIQKQMHVKWGRVRKREISKRTHARVSTKGLPLVVSSPKHHPALRSFKTPRILFINSGGSRIWITGGRGILRPPNLWSCSDHGEGSPHFRGHAPREILKIAMRIIYAFFNIWGIISEKSESEFAR